ncbi:hypothetical protein Mapa_011656 [Marchantia paleacea]|nr:hypothetical protein Mapa_011656 [Marchantia paleacea]
MNQFIRMPLIKQVEYGITYLLNSKRIVVNVLGCSSQVLCCILLRGGYSLHQQIIAHRDPEFLLSRSCYHKHKLDAAQVMLRLYVCISLQLGRNFVTPYDIHFELHASHNQV